MFPFLTNRLSPELNLGIHWRSSLWILSYSFSFERICRKIMKFSPPKSSKTVLETVVQLLSRVGLCNPMDCSMPGFPVFHYLPDFAQTHVHWVSDAIQPSHPLLSPSPAFNLSQHQGRLFARGGQSTGVSASASIFPMNIWGWLVLGLTGLISLLPMGLPRVFSSTTIGKHQFLAAQASLWSNSHIHTWLL